MRHIFIDLEFCTCFRKSSPLRTETIEIGAVKLDENYRLIDEFDRLVRPDFARSIPSTERNLTGISWNMVENESSFTDVFYDFMKWVGDGEYLIYSWSTNDPIQCLRESKVKGFPIVESGMMKRWIDFQKVFMNAAGLKNQISLERAVELCDIYFAGDAHRACVDAYNTARIFRFCQAFETVEMNVFFLAGIENILIPARKRDAAGRRRRSRSGGRIGGAPGASYRKPSEGSRADAAADGSSAGTAAKPASGRRPRRSSSARKRKAALADPGRAEAPGRAMEGSASPGGETPRKAEPQPADSAGADGAKAPGSKGNGPKTGSPNAPKTQTAKPEGSPQGEPPASQPEKQDAGPDQVIRVSSKRKRSSSRRRGSSSGVSQSAAGENTVPEPETPQPSAAPAKAAPRRRRSSKKSADNGAKSSGADEKQTET